MIQPYHWNTQQKIKCKNPKDILWYSSSLGPVFAIVLITVIKCLAKYFKGEQTNSGSQLRGTLSVVVDKRWMWEQLGS